RYKSVLLAHVFFFSSRRRHTRSVSAFLLNRSSDLCRKCLHFHAVHFMRTLPTGSVDPNFGRRVRNRRQLNSLQNTWPYGYSMPRSEERRVGEECRSWWETAGERAQLSRVAICVSTT